MTPKQQRTTVGIVTAAFVSLLIVSLLGQNEPVQATPTPASPQAVQDAFQTIEQHIEVKPLPPSPVSVMKPTPVAKPRYTTVCPCPRKGYGPLRGGGWWRGGPVRRVVSFPFRRH